MWPHTVLPIAISCPVVFSWISSTVWNLFPFQGDFSFRKSQRPQSTKSGLSGGWVIWVIWCFAKSSAQTVMHEQVYCCDEAANRKLPIAMALWIIWMVSTEECSSLMKNLMQICCSTHSVILNAVATQYTWALNGIYCPRWLVQWSRHCSRTCIPVHSPWLPSMVSQG